MSTTIINEVHKCPGNAWIICRSKRYQGRIYYFNTLTGEAVWNLSEPEIEKAKRTMNRLGKYPVDNCPEPSESPRDSKEQSESNINENNAVPKIFNKHLNSIYKKLSKDHYTPISQVQLVPVQPLYNPYIWNVPNQPVLVGSINQSNYIPVSDTSITLSNRFQNFSSNNLLQSKKEDLEINIDGPNNYNTLVKQNDLREILSARRSKARILKNSQNIFEGLYRAGSQQQQDKIRNGILDMRDCEWLEENLQKNGYQNLLDMTILKKLVKLENISDYNWYIVMDTNVLLNNINFLNVLLRSDEGCSLIVPQIVMDEIQKATNSHMKARANKAAYFISQQAALNKATIDDEKLAEDDSSPNEVLNCCSRLSEQGCCVVLLSNNSEIHSYKSNVIYPILSVREVKMILLNKLQDTVHAAYNSNENLSLKDGPSIKITIPNKPEQFEVKENVSMNNAASNHIQNSEIFENDRISETINPSIAKLTNEINSNKVNNHFPDIGNDYMKQGTLESKSELKSFASRDNLCSTTSPLVKNFKGRRKRNEFHNSIENSRNEEIQSNSYSSFSIYLHKTEMSNQCIGKDVALECPKFASDEFLTTSNVKQVQKDIIINDEKNVMFEVTSHSMEEYLKINCDEWISRLTQIMEEVLTQVLQKNPSYNCEAMPPPWTLYEASECIKRKFSTDCDIVDAANKLCNTLFDIGGLRGKLKTVTPQKYMRLYSYCVYVTDTLQGVLSNCEDLQVASESLSKLLNDIQHPCLDFSSQDPITDISMEEKEEGHQENEVEMQQGRSEQVRNDENLMQETFQKDPIVQVTQAEGIPATKEEESPSIQLISPLKYNLRSSKKNTPQKHERSDPKTCFFSNLDLVKRAETVVHTEPLSNEVLDNSNICEEENTSIADNNEKILNTIVNDVVLSQDKSTSDEPKVIRNFVRCLEFEEKLKYKYGTANSYDPVDEENMGEYYDSFNEEGEYYSNDYLEEEYNENEYNTEEYDGNEYDAEKYDGNEHDAEIYDENEHDAEKYDRNKINESFHLEKEASSYQDDDNFKLVKHFIEDTLKQSKESLSLTKTFCEKAYDALNSSPNDQDRIKVHCEATDIHANILHICEMLDSILKRESTISSDCISEAMKQPAGSWEILRDKMEAEYRTCVAKYSEQANILKESLRLLIDASKR